MNDQISRQKLIEKLKHWHLTNTEHGVTWLPEHFVAKAIEALSQPPADQWIPCSERLPDTEEEVWVILGYTYKSDCTQKSIARYIRFENGEAHWCDNKWGYLEWEKYSDGHGGCSSYKVLAWMPAEPYKGVE